MKIQYLNGDATELSGSGIKLIAHICNDVGGWGKGFTASISSRWLNPENRFRKWARDANLRKDGSDFVGKYQLGNVQTVQTEESKVWVCNMVAQHGYSTPGNSAIRYDALEKCLKQMYIDAFTLKATVHACRFGTGLAGGDWSKIEPLIEAEMNKHGTGISTTIYDYVP